ncbi:MAG: DMT family transporter [Acutalibacteraceae bacterium]|nr:DMT family transporter [Acutalibacteraceae bacterium]
MKKAYIYAAISILCWSTIATVSKLLLGSLSSYQVLMCSAFFATGSLLVINLITGRFKKLLGYRFKDIIIMVLIGLPGTFFYYVFLYSGTARMAASQAFIINYLWPVMSVVFACILLKEKLTIKTVIALVLSFLGVLTVAGDRIFDFGSGSFLGVILCILAAVSYGLFTALCEKWDYDYLVSMMVSFFVTFILTASINAITGTPISITLPQMLGFAWNGIFVMAIATVTWALALKNGDTAKISNLAYITPFLSLVWTFFILKEPIELMSVAGLGVIVLGIFVQLKGTKKTQK